MSGKPVDYLWAFLIGGALCTAAQLVFELLLGAGVEFGLAITLMLAVACALSGVFAVLGQYQKLESLGGFGAMLPFSGFSSAIVQFTAAALDRGESLPAAARKGLADAAAFMIFGIGLPMALAVAALTALW